MPRIYGKRFDGKMFEVQNIPNQRGDVLVMQALSETQENKVCKLQADGRSDTQIWRALHPERKLEEKPCKTGEFRLSLEQLTKAQLILLIENSMDQPLDSLQNMTREDLITLMRHFGDGKADARVTLSP
jgi:hypothetical protein